MFLLLSISLLLLLTMPVASVDTETRRSSVTAGRCDAWCPAALTNGQHDPKTVCTTWGPPCSGCAECRCDAWCGAALTNGQHDPNEVCTAWMQCTGCAECFDMRAAPKPCEAKPCKVNIYFFLPFFVFFRLSSSRP